MLFSILCKRRSAEIIEKYTINNLATPTPCLKKLLCVSIQGDDFVFEYYFEFYPPGVHSLYSLYEQVIHGLYTDASRGDAKAGASHVAIEPFF